jgi:hypothetical protein
MAAGYSTNPLYKKLGLKEGITVKLVHAPWHYPELIGEMFEKLNLKNTATKDVDFIHFFTNSLAEVAGQLPALKQQIKKDGAIWISWYKMSAGKPTELTENIIRNIGLAARLVDVKVCAVDEEWSGLKFVYRLTDR